MLSVVSCRSISSSPSLYLSQFRLRHQQFIARQAYDVKTLEDMEFDEYDTLAAIYLVWSEDGKTALGCSRLTPLSYGCMLKEHFPGLVDDHSVFSEQNIWEGTRFCIDNRLPPEKRRRVLQDIAVAYLELGVFCQIPRIIGLMPTLILRSVFERNGIRLTPLGQVTQIGEHSKIQASAIEVSAALYHQACERTGCESPLGLVPVERRLKHVA